MNRIGGIWWPKDTSKGQRAHSLRYVNGIEWAITNCMHHRTAVQAGGNIGLWPRRLAQSFRNVVTFEPDEISMRCLMLNVPPNVAVHQRALGATRYRCGIKRRSLGSHRIVAGWGVQVIPLDELNLAEVDLIALDIEGYELHALKGAEETIKRSSPMIQCEVRGDEVKYGYCERDVHEFLGGMGYRQVSRQPGPDAVFARA